MARPGPRRRTPPCAADHRGRWLPRCRLGAEDAEVPADHPATVAALRQHRARQAEELLAVGIQRSDGRHVFVREDGRSYHPQQLTKMLASRAKAAGVPVVRPHALRHGHATAGLEMGIPMKVMSERLGHSSLAITADIYSHVSQAVDQAAAAQIATAIDGA